MTGQEIVNWEEKLKEEAKAVAVTERAQVTRISLKSGIMAIGETPIKDNTLDCVILAHIHENLYFKDPYEPGVIKPPTCYAYSPTGEAMKPHLDIQPPQHPTCDGCWANQFGSAPNGRKGKACGVGRRKIAVLPAYKEAKDMARAEMAIISLPFMSVKNWSNHVNLLAANPAIQRAPWGVLSRITVKPDLKSQFKVYFDYLDNLSDEFLGIVHAKIPMAMNVLMTPYDLTEPEPQAAPKEEKKKKY